jgi:hypothetical protein
MSYLSKVNVDSLKQVKLVSFGSQIAFQNPNGTWVSIQPDGSEQTRPNAQVPAAYELATPLGNGLALFTSDGTASYIRKYVE